jgi:hypothetical protein
VWLIPLIWGWYAIGTHHGGRTKVDDILHERTKDIQLDDLTHISESDNTCIFRSIETEKSYYRTPTIDGAISTAVEPPRLWHFVKVGDENRDGPFYNYARCGTWSYLAINIVKAFEKSLEPSEGDEGNDNHQNKDKRFSRSLKICSILKGESIPRFEWNKQAGWKWDLRLRKLKAFGMAFIVQGITGWGAFFIVYGTPTTGLGCHSLMYLVFSLVSTVSCLLFILSSHLFDSWGCEREVYKRDLGGRGVGMHLNYHRNRVSGVHNVPDGRGSQGVQRDEQNENIELREMNARGQQVEQVEGNGTVRHVEQASVKVAWGAFLTGGLAKFIAGTQPILIFYQFFTSQLSEL